MKNAILYILLGVVLFLVYRSFKDGAPNQGGTATNNPAGGTTTTATPQEDGTLSSILGAVTAVFNLGSKIMQSNPKTN